MPFRRYFYPYGSPFLPNNIDQGFMAPEQSVPTEDFDYGDNYFGDQEREPNLNQEQDGPPNSEYENEPNNSFSRDEATWYYLFELLYQLQRGCALRTQMMGQVLFEINELKNIVATLERQLREANQSESNTRKMEPKSNVYEKIVQFGCTAIVSMAVFWFLNRN